MSKDTRRCGLCGRDPSWKGLIGETREGYDCPVCGGEWATDASVPGGYPQCPVCTVRALRTQADAMKARASTLEHFADRLEQKGEDALSHHARQVARKLRSLDRLCHERQEKLEERADELDVDESERFLGPLRDEEVEETARQGEMQL